MLPRHYQTLFISHSVAFFGRIGIIASNEVILHLINAKCFPVLYFVLETCRLHKSQYSFMNYAINSTFRKIFSTRLQEAVDDQLKNSSRCCWGQTLVGPRNHVLDRGCTLAPPGEYDWMLSVCSGGSASWCHHYCGHCCYLVLAPER